MNYTMKQYKTLVFYSNKPPNFRSSTVETIYRGILRIPEKYKPPKWTEKLGIFGSKFKNSLVGGYDSLGYVNDWRDAFNQNPNLFVNEVNILDYFSLVMGFKKIKEVDLIIILHSALGDSAEILINVAEKFNSRKCPLVVFIGNEYDLLIEKKTFLRNSNANFICSQLPLSAAEFLYGDLTDTKVLTVPHACNPKVYNSNKNFNKTIDFIFVGAKYPLWLGDSERNDFLSLVSENLRKMQLVIKIGQGNLPRDKWASRLASSHGTIGAEAGTYFLDREGRILTAAKESIESNDFVEEYISFDFSKYAKDHNIKYVCGKAISSRHFEALGTRTVQILLEGSYNDILEPDIHYLSVKKDFSNLKDKINEFKDPSRRQSISEMGYEFVMDLHTYSHRIKSLLNAIGF